VKLAEGLHLVLADIEHARKTRCFLNLHPPTLSRPNPKTRIAANRPPRCSRIRNDAEAVGPREMRFYRFIPTLIVFLVIVLVITGCGKKGGGY
jgi:hypothetical protein